MSDWWTQPSTPAKASAFHSPARQNSSTSRARFVSDDPDPTAAEAPKFLPSFAASPAGKIALGSSPNVSSPSIPTRSPTARFSTSHSLAESTSSPRNVRRSIAQPQMEEDMIPTFSLHDEPPRPASAPVQASLPTPPALEPSSDTTTLHVFGPPPEQLAQLKPYFENIGPVVSYVPGPDGSNWWTVTYANPLAASYALRRHGEIVNGRWMLGLKVAGPGSTAGLTLVNGAESGAGNVIQVQKGNIIKPTPKKQTLNDAYAWELPEQQTGLLGRAAEFIFGR